MEDLLFYGVLGVVLGGRLGYVIFYKPLYYADHLRDIAGDALTGAGGDVALTIGSDAGTQFTRTSRSGLTRTS